ncbi:MAG TPA: cytochrome C oxidase subunit IV family protein [Thermoanaerobaculaceae bacterium]|nr:cytochrome C oxidase subunit IV family protein [Thermoanaerobaculaceae bacterium]HPS77123.1 cytochrome C oxidase subunit IV family protein [Thermoanaerobaculaceae bacterium]
MTSADAASSDHSGALAHVVPWRLLAGVWATLVFLTVVTVAITWVDLGRLNLVAALLIATIKASLVLLYFMHLRWDRPFNAVIFVATLCFAALFITLALLDTTTYQPDLIPGYAPAIKP